jgi:predicted RNase H-like HicB family nuclease
METKNYLAIAEQRPGESNWSIAFPAFPGVTSVAEKAADVQRQ